MIQSISGNITVLNIVFVKSIPSPISLLELAQVYSWACFRGRSCQIDIDLSFGQVTANTHSHYKKSNVDCACIQCKHMGLCRAHIYRRQIRTCNQDTCLFLCIHGANGCDHCHNRVDSCGHNSACHTCTRCKYTLQHEMQLGCRHRCKMSTIHKYSDPYWCNLYTQ